VSRSPSSQRAQTSDCKKKKLVKLVKNGQAKELPKKTKAYTIKKKEFQRKPLKSTTAEDAGHFKRR